MMWVGWILTRQGAPWQRVASGPTLSACHKQLLATARRLGLGGRPRVMTTGRVPAAVLAGRDHDAPAAGPPR
jgi:hypothetical protein